MYTVREVAKMLDLTEYTIRYYTDNGLVPSVQRDINNNRVFDDDSLNWLAAVRFGRNCGMSIKDIKRFVELSLEGDSTVQERYEMVLKQKAVALARLEDTKRSIEYLEQKEKHFLDVINAVIPDDTNPGTWTNRNQVQIHY